MELNGTLTTSGNLSGSFQTFPGNYEKLNNKPSINGVVLVGNKTSEDLHIMSGGGGTSDYTELTNKPSINGVELIGNKTSEDLGITSTDKVDKAVELYGYIMASSGTFTLNDSIDNYDYITFIYGISQNRVEMSVQNMQVSDLNYIYDYGEDVFLVGYGNRYIKFRLAGSTLTITGRGGDNTPVIYRIVGHKQAPYNPSAPMIKLAAYGRDKNVNTTTTWTALHDGLYLVANFNVNSDGGNKTLASAISSTGNIYDSWNSTGVSGADTRCYNMTWAIVEAAAGDTITLDRSSEGSYSVQTYGIYELINMYPERMTGEFVAMAPDNTLNGTYTLTPSDTFGSYIAFTLVDKAVSSDLAYADFTIRDDGTDHMNLNTFPYPELSNLMVDLAFNTETFNFKASNVNGYVSKGYGLIKLD